MIREFRLNGWRVQPQLHQLVGPGGAVEVEAHSMEVLVALARRAGEVVSRQELLEDVWGDSAIEEGALTHAIWDLRRALGDDPKRPRFIQTLTKRGYRLVAEVAWGDQEGEESQRREAVSRRRPTRLWLTAAVALVALGITVVWLVSRLAEPPGWQDENRVVVAPFADPAGAPDLAGLGQVAADWLTAGLSRSEEVAVVPSSSVRQSLWAEGGGDESPGDVTALAEEMGAGIVVLGSFYLQGEALQAHAEVIDAVRSELLYSLTPVTGPSRDPMVLLGELSQRVMGFFAVKDLGISSDRPPRFDAYREYLAGLELFATDYEGAFRHFQRSMELDPSFLSPRLYITSGLMNQGRYLESERMLRALEADRHRLAQLDRLVLDWSFAALDGRTHDALRIMRRAEALAPKSRIPNYLVARYSLLANRPGETVDTLARIPADRWQHHVFGGYRLWHLTSALHLLQDHRAELEAARQGRGLYPDHLATLACEIRARAALGDTDEVGRLVEESLVIQPLQVTAGEVLLEAVLELRAHGHPKAAREMAQRAVAWHRQSVARDGRPEQKQGLARALYLAGQWQESRRLFQEIVAQLPDDVAAIGDLAAASLRSGDREEALRISIELERLDRRFLFGGHLYQSARTAAVSGDRQRAMKLLREAMARGSSEVLWLHRDIDLEPLRGYPPFQEFLRPKD